MSGNEDEENNVDLYSDIPAIHYDETITSLEQTNKALENEVKVLKEKLEILTERSKKLEVENKNLGTNISVLYKTAVNEIQRKDRMIAELRREKDSIVFRRINTQSSSKTDCSVRAEVEPSHFSQEDKPREDHGGEGEGEEEKEEYYDDMVYEEQEDVDVIYQEWQDESQMPKKVSVIPQTIFSKRREEKLHRQQAGTLSEVHDKDEKTLVSATLKPEQCHVPVIKSEIIEEEPIPDPIQARLLLLSNSINSVPKNQSSPVPDIRRYEKNSSQNISKEFSNSHTYVPKWSQASPTAKCVNNLKSKYVRSRSKSRTPVRTVPEDKRDDKQYSDRGKGYNQARNEDTPHHRAGKEPTHHSPKGNSKVPDSVKQSRSENDSSKCTLLKCKSELREESLVLETGVRFETKLTEEESSNFRIKDIKFSNTVSSLVSSNNSMPMEPMGCKPKNSEIQSTDSQSTIPVPPSQENTANSEVLSHSSEKPTIFKDGKVSFCFSSEQCEFQTPRRRKTTMKLKLKTNNTPSNLKIEPNNSESEGNYEKKLKRHLEDDQESPHGPESKKIKACNDSQVSDFGLAVRKAGCSLKKNETPAVNVEAADVNLNGSDKNLHRLSEAENIRKVMDKDTEKNCSGDLEEGEVLEPSPSKTCKFVESKNLSAYTSSEMGQTVADYKSKLNSDLTNNRNKASITEGPSCKYSDNADNIRPDTSVTVNKEANELKVHKFDHGSSNHSRGSYKEHKHKESLRMCVPKWRTQNSRSRQMKDPSRRSHTPILRRLSNGCERRSPSELLRGDRRVERLRQVGNSRYVERSRDAHTREDRSNSRHYGSEGRSRPSSHSDNKHKHKLQSECLKKEKKHEISDDKIICEKRSTDSRRSSVSGNHNKNVDRISSNGEKLSFVSESREMKLIEKKDLISDKENSTIPLKKADDHSRTGSKQINNVTEINFSSVEIKEDFPSKKMNLKVANTPDRSSYEVKNANSISQDLAYKDILIYDNSDASHLSEKLPVTNTVISLKGNSLEGKASSLSPHIFQLPACAETNLPQNMDTNAELSKKSHGIGNHDLHSEIMNHSETDTHENSSHSTTLASVDGNSFPVINNIPHSSTDKGSPNKDREQPSAKRFVMKKRLSKSGTLGNSDPVTSDNSKKNESKSENCFSNDDPKLTDTRKKNSSSEFHENNGNSQIDTHVSEKPSENKIHSESINVIEERQTNSEQKTPSGKRFVMKKRHARPSVLGNSETQIIASIKSSISPPKCSLKPDDGDMHSLSISKFYKGKNEFCDTSNSMENSKNSSVNCVISSTCMEPMEGSERGSSSSISVRAGERTASGLVQSLSSSVNMKSQSTERLVATPPDFRERYAAVFQHYGQSRNTNSDDDEELEEFSSSISESDDDSDSTYNPKKGRNKKRKRTGNRMRQSNKKTQ